MEPHSESKLAKSHFTIRYQMQPSGGKRCGNCQMFRTPCSCTAVAGVISDNGWCKIHYMKLGVQRYDTRK